MTNEQIIEEANNLPFIKEANIKLKKIRFLGNKEGLNREIVVYFEEQRYPCRVWISCFSLNERQSLPAFVPGVMEGDKDYWSKDIRIKLCHWLFCRFWIWLKRVDVSYDNYVNGNFGKNSSINSEDKWEVSIFTGLIHDGWSIQKHNLKHLFELPQLKDMYQWYNNDIKDNLYKNFGHIEYGSEEYQELTTEEEFKKVRIVF